MSSSEKINIQTSDEDGVRSWLNQAQRELGADKDGGTDWRSVRNKLWNAWLWTGDDLERRFYVQFVQEGLTQDSAERLARAAAWVVSHG